MVRGNVFNENTGNDLSTPLLSQASPLTEDTTPTPPSASEPITNGTTGSSDPNASANANANQNQNPNQNPSESPPHPRRAGSTRRLLQLASPQLFYLYAGCAVLICRLPFSLAMPHFVSTTLAAVASSDFVAARREIQCLFVAGTIDALLDFGAFFLFGFANQRIVRALRVDLFRRLLGQEMAFFDTHSSGELASRLNSDCNEMASDLTWFFRFSIESVVRIIGITSYMMWRSPLLGACALSIIPLVAVINKLYGDWLRDNAIGLQDALAEANAVAHEALSNVRTVVCFGAEALECQRFEQRIQRHYQLNVRQLGMQALYYMTVSTFLINTVVQGALLWFGAYLIEHNKLTPGILLAFMLYQSQLQNETLSLMNSYTSLIKSSGAGDKVFVLLDRIPPPPSTAHAHEQAAFTALADTVPHSNPPVCGLNGDTHAHTDSTDNVDEERGLPPDNESSLDNDQSQYAVTLENVSFAYPSRPDNPILTALTLEIPRGQTLALVGKSGCGKTTLVNLLLRFYDPTSGRLLINGVDLRELDLMKHRGRVGVVTQDPALFRGTLRDNILYGSRTGSTNSTEMVERAACLAHADSFIRNFPEGYETTVGDRGVQLSGGQKQRIAIARAIVVSHSLLILDEATSSLDAESETAVQQALDQLLDQHSMTTIVIAHRLRTVKNADKIVVLESGRVIEEGKHDDLILRPDSVYRKMVEQANETGVLPES